MRRGSLQQRVAMAGRCSFGDAELEIAVQILVRIEIGRVGWQVEEGDLVGVRGDPSAHLLCLVHVQVVEDQKDFAARVSDEARGGSLGDLRASRWSAARNGDGVRQR